MDRSFNCFLYFNVWPARIFLGDSGALSFGATLAVIGLITGYVFALFLVGAIYVLEAMSSAIQIFGWKFLKRPIFLIAPAHHIFLARGWEEPKIVTNLACRIDSFYFCSLAFYDINLL